MSGQDETHAWHLFSSSIVGLICGGFSICDTSVIFGHACCDMFGWLDYFADGHADLSNA